MYIELDATTPTPAEAYVLPYGTHVWAIAGHILASRDMLTSEDAVARTASYYDMDPEAVCAALLYATEHPHAIASRLAENSSYWTNPEAAANPKQEWRVST